MRQVKIKHGYVFRRGLKCRGEDMEILYFDQVMSDVGEGRALAEQDVDRLISFLRRWKSRSSTLHESGVTVRAHANAIIRETNNFIGSSLKKL